MPYAVILLILVSLSTLVCWAVTGRLLRILRLDVPNARSSHSLPVPRGGGLAVLACFLPCLAAIIYGLWDQDLITRPQAMGWVMLGMDVVILGIVSWFDDRHSLPVMARLAAQIGCVSGMMMVMEPVILTAGFLPLWADQLLQMILWVGFVNLFNFMDGIDGLSVVESLTILGGIMIFSSWLGEMVPESLASAAIAGAMLGFAIWNWHPARVFLGDVGSVPLGFVIGFLLLRLVAEGHGWAALVLPLYYLADGGLTFVTRLIRGEKVWEAHRKHAYQRAAIALGRHDRVVLRILAANLVLMVAAIGGHKLVWLYALAPVSVGWLMWHLLTTGKSRGKAA